MNKATISPKAQIVLDAVIAIRARPFQICDHTSLEGETGFSISSLRGFITNLKKKGLVEEKFVGPDLNILPI
jgi:hypothetical protein